MINEATLIGRIGKKDIRELKNGTEMATLYLATNRKWLDSSGVQQEQTVWHNVNFFNKLADIVKKYAHVGNLVYIKGEINHKQITKGEREGQWAYSITGSQLKLLPSGTKKAADNTTNENPDHEAVIPSKTTKKFVEDYDDLNDTIPF